MSVGRVARLEAQAAASAARDPELIAVAFGVPRDTAAELVRVAGAADVTICELVAWLRGTRSAADHSVVALAIQRFRGGHCHGHELSPLLTPPRTYADHVVGGAS